MTLVEMKAKLHQQIDNSDEKLLKIIYAMVTEYDQEGENIDDARKKLVLAERDRYLAGIGRSYTRDEARNMIIKGIRPDGI
jgi:hypothetical protein